MTDLNEVEILLVEDNPNDVELTLRALKNNKLTNRIHVVRDGAEALDFLFSRGAYSGRNATSLPKVVLLDLKLPKVDGLEVLKQIKQDPRTHVLPVVVLTSSAQSPDIDRAYDAGANSYLVKPVAFESLLGLVRTLGLYWIATNEGPVIVETAP